MSESAGQFLTEHYSNGPRPAHVPDNILEAKFTTLLESQNEVFKDQMKSFFPMLWNMFKGNINYILPFTAPRIRSEEATLQNYIKELNIEVRMNNDPIRNAYTYPWVKSSVNASLVNLVPVVGAVAYLMNG